MYQFNMKRSIFSLEKHTFNFRDVSKTTILCYIEIHLIGNVLKHNYSAKHNTCSDCETKRNKDIKFISEHHESFDQLSLFSEPFFSITTFLKLQMENYNSGRWQNELSSTDAEAASLLLDFKDNNPKVMPEEICFYLENREFQMSKMIALQVLCRTTM